MSLHGRVCEAANGRFVEAKPEERRFAVRPVWSNPSGRFGSAVTGRAEDEQPFDLAVTKFDVG